ncbi:UNVERIFIED_CONTAM: hypothetical protein Slati_4485700 [Sesamum latifolium]|uniref:Uncharacterized protein n=1 Tax=Sesamum latifolium TaxID=2727402 RepID=A0AAW2SRK0_9LAMI
MGSCQAQDTSHSFHNARTYPLQEVLYAPSAPMILLANHEADAIRLVSKCESAKSIPPHTSASRTPHYNVVPCPLHIVGIDIVGPFPLAMAEEVPSGAIDYFTKTTLRGSTGETPFSLVYGTEAIIPAELGIPSHRVMNFSKECNENLLRENLDLIEELREKAFLRVQRYKNIMISSYNRRVKSRSFQVGDLVLQRADALKLIGKLDPTWEGPYKVTSVIGKGAYELEDPEGWPLPRPWNIHNLKKYFRK